MPSDEPRQVQRTIIDFRSLILPDDVRSALADAFWNYVGPRQPTSILFQWYHLRVFGRFVVETRSVRRLEHFDRALLVRYIEWLGQQRTASGRPWSKSTRFVAYNSLRKLLQWLERCRPGLIQPIDYPYNPFPWRRRDTEHRKGLPPGRLREILKACEKDILGIRGLRRDAAEEMRNAVAGDLPAIASRGALLAYIEQHWGGIVPSWRVLRSPGFSQLQQALSAHGHARAIAPCLYPTSDAIFPYYLAILIHTAGNPESIAALGADCLRPVPLLDDREMLVWEKPRAASLQRRAFRRDAALDPPALVRDILEWTSRLRREVTSPLRERLFLCKAAAEITTLRPENLVYVRRRFVKRHGLSDFQLAALRPSVLTAFYRASGDLIQVKGIANHANVATTVAYVETPEVEAQNRIRVATLQNALVGHLRAPDTAPPKSGPPGKPADMALSSLPTEEAVSMFGFSCKDPLAGIAPGTRSGELCTNFLGCLTCPNAVLTYDARTLARLLQARDHLRAASADIHPARWAAIYAPQLSILEEDILTRFSDHEIGTAERLRSSLPPLPPLR